MSLNFKDISITVVVPVHNEQGNAAALAREINQAGKYCEIKKIVFVDDNSSDNTRAELDAITDEIETLEVLQHQTQSGQSAAIFTGIRSAKTDWVLTMDGDGQNVPDDIPKMVQALVDSGNENIKLVNGNRNLKDNRKDTVIKKISSKVANTVRSAMLKDNMPDSGCGLKLMCRETYLSLPYFTNLHRFTPALFLRTGAEIMSVDVGHRQRSSGASHYGIWNRLWIGIIDLLGVSWLMRKGYKAQLKK